MICILFRIIEANPTSADVPTSLVSMHIPREIFAIPARSNRMLHRAAISGDRNNRFANRNERGRSSWQFSRSSTLREAGTIGVRIWRAMSKLLKSYIYHLEIV